MALDSCDHGDSIVVRDNQKTRECPLCAAEEMIKELEELVKNM